MELITFESQAYQNLINEIKSIKEALGTKTNDKQIWLTSEQAQNKLNVSAKTLQTYRDKRIIPFSQFGSKILYKNTDIEEHLMSYYIPAKKR